VHIDQITYLRNKEEGVRTACILDLIGVGGVLGTIVTRHHRALREARVPPPHRTLERLEGASVVSRDGAIKVAPVGNVGPLDVGDDTECVRGASS
jgi:hypothetical protein